MAKKSLMSNFKCGKLELAATQTQSPNTTEAILIAFWIYISTFKLGYNKITAVTTNLYPIYGTK